VGVVTVETELRDGLAILHVTGEIAYGASTALLRRKCRELVDAGEVRIVLDLLAVPWLDSSGIGEVFACYKRARAHGGEVKLVLRGKSRSLFTFTELHRVFEIFDDLEAALTSFDAKPQAAAEEP
jgi:anti-sigma B factor antagonist